MPSKLRKRSCNNMKCYVGYELCPALEEISYSQIGLITRKFAITDGTHSCFPRKWEKFMQGKSSVSLSPLQQSGAKMQFPHKALLWQIILDTTGLFFLMYLDAFWWKKRIRYTRLVRCLSRNMINQLILHISCEAGRCKGRWINDSSSQL